MQQEKETIFKVFESLFPFSSFNAISLTRVDEGLESFYPFLFTHRLDIVLEQHVTQIGAALVALDVQLSLEIKSAKIYWLMHFPFPSASANFTIVSRPRKVGRVSNFPGTTPRSTGPTCNGLLDQTPSPLTTPLFFPIYLCALILSVFSSTRCIIKFIFQLLLNIQNNTRYECVQDFTQPD